MIISAILGAAGFLVGSAAFYFTHRTVFHSKRTSKVYKILFHRWNPLAPLARWGRGIHLAHHREHTLSKRTGVVEELNMFFPWRVKLFVAVAVTGIALVSFPFAMGVISFFPFYAYRHTAAHRHDSSGKTLKPWMRHHLYHHERNPAVNHSGTLPIIDKIFGTNEKPPESWKPEENYLTRAS